VVKHVVYSYNNPYCLNSTPPQWIFILRLPHKRTLNSHTGLSINILQRTTSLTCG